MKYQDPFAQREAEKYERPIPSRELIIQIIKEQGVPLNLEELAKLLGVTEEVDTESLRQISLPFLIVSRTYRPNMCRAIWYTRSRIFMTMILM